MIIRLANKDDCLEVAKLHVQEIKSGFLSELGEKFLYYFYQTMVDSFSAFLIVAEDNNLIVGFISGCTDFKNFYRDFAKKYAFRVSLALFKKFFSINSLKKYLKLRSILNKKKKIYLNQNLFQLRFLLNSRVRELLNNFYLNFSPK